MQPSRIGRHFEFGGHIGSNINYYKSETFSMPNKTFVDNFIGLLQKNVLRKIYCTIHNPALRRIPSNKTHA